jgi:ribose/xylose/arabinose/galactoside ABC-type transport system permease subunit
MGRDLGPLLVTLGLLVVFAGVLAWSGGLSWFGHLPGDIRIEGENVRVYVPWVSMLVVSVGISIVLFLVSLFRR